MVYRPQTLFLIAALAGLGGCTPALEYPPPTQKVMPTGEEPPGGTNTVVISDRNVNMAVVRDVLGGDPGSPWRWTNQHPRLRVWIQPGDRVNFYVRFTIAGDVVKKVGPQTIRMMVDEQVLDTKTFGTEGEQEYQKPVPPAMLGDRREIIVGMDIDPVFIAPADGMKLGVLLQEIGLKLAARR
jgi:hypothetical protein